MAYFALRERLPNVTLRRASALTAAGALALPASLFLSWFEILGGVKEGNYTGWYSFHRADRVLALLGLVALASAFLTPSRRSAASRLLVGLLATAVVTREMLSPPVIAPITQLRGGAYLGLTGALAVTFGGLLALNSIRTPVVRMVRRDEAAICGLRALGRAGVGWPAVGLALTFGTLALLGRLSLMTRRHGPTGSDGQEYLAAAGVRGYHDLSLPRPPGYLTFIAALDRLPGRVEDALIAAQHLVGVAIVVAVFLLAWVWFGRCAAILAGALATLSPALVAVEGHMHPDILFTALVLTGSVFLVRALVIDGWRPWALCFTGVSFALATHMKPIGQALLVATPLAFALSGRKPGEIPKSTAIVAMGFTLAMAPALVYNQAQHGELLPTSNLGATLFTRAFEVDSLPIPVDSRGGRLAARVERRLVDKHGPFPSGPGAIEQVRRRGLPRLHAEVASKLRSPRYHRPLMDERETLAVRKDLALRAIRQHMGSYLISTAPLSAELLSNVGQPPPPAHDEALGMEDPSGLSLTALRTWGLFEPLGRTWWFLSLNGLAGLTLFFAPRTRPGAAALWSIWSTVVVATALSHGGLWRYGASLAPLIWMLGSAGVVFLTSLLFAQVRTTYEYIVRRQRGGDNSVTRGSDQPFS